MHIEWKTPSEVTGESQGRGNSGVFLQELYEVQVLDSYNNRTYRNGQAASMYKQYAPLVNVCRKPGEWQTYDIIYTAPTFGKDSTLYATPPRVTVFKTEFWFRIMSVLEVQLNTLEFLNILLRNMDRAVLNLQDHGNPVAYRNIWIREL